MDEPLVAQVNDPLFAFRPILAMLWAERAMMLVALMLCIIAALVYLHLAQPIYTAELKLTAAENQSRLPAGLGGLASLAGVSIPGGESSQLSLYREVVRSRESAAWLANDTELMRRVFPDKWDQTTGQWRQPSGIVADLKYNLKWLLGFKDLRWHAPDVESMYRYLDNNLLQVEDSKTGVLSVSIDHSDRLVALELLSRLNDHADDLLRHRALTRSSDYIAYLVAKLPTVTIAEQRMALVETLSQQERIRMMANADVPYSAEPLGEITASALPTAPKNILVIAVGIISGIVLGSIAASLRYVQRRRRIGLAG